MQRWHPSWRALDACGSVGLTARRPSRPPGDFSEGLHRYFFRSTTRDCRHFLSSCCENALEFRQIDDIRWLDAARRAFLEGMKQRMKIAFHITPAQRDASIQEQESSNVPSKLVGDSDHRISSIFPSLTSFFQQALSFCRAFLQFVIGLFRASCNCCVNLLILKC